MSESYSQDGIKYFHSIDDDGSHWIQIQNEDGYSDSCISLSVDEIPAFIETLKKVVDGPVHHDFRVSTLQLRARYGDDFAG